MKEPLYQLISYFFQKLPKFKGKLRLGTFLLKITRIQKCKNIQLKTKNGNFIIPGFDENLAKELFVNGTYEKGLVDLLVKGIPHFGVFIDVGANIGSISIPIAIRRPDVTVISIEASPWIYTILSKNAKLNSLTNITCLNYALYKKSGLELPIYAPKDKYGKGSLGAVFTKEFELVKTITLDDIKLQFCHKKIDFIKVDVEGFELNVFEGSTQILKTDKPYIIFEFIPWAEELAGFELGEAQLFLLNNLYELQTLSNDFRGDGEFRKSISINHDANFFARPSFKRII